MLGSSSVNNALFPACFTYIVKKKLWSQAGRIHTVTCWLGFQRALDLCVEIVAMGSRWVVRRIGVWSFTTTAARLFFMQSRTALMQNSRKKRKGYFLVHQAFDMELILSKLSNAMAEKRGSEVHSSNKKKGFCNLKCSFKHPFLLLCLNVICKISQRKYLLLYKKKYPVDFDVELKIIDVRYDNMT